MCGIIGYTGRSQALPVLLNGLRRMEYRGYDSAGVALLNDGHTKIVKRPGKIVNLSSALEAAKPTGTTGIGHTRWATHGAPNQINAHPHGVGRITIVHNGIIENYAELKHLLTTQHHRKFKTDTDTEVLAHLIAVEREAAESLEAAVLTSLLQVEGTFGLLVLDEREAGKIVAARRGSPLLLGVAKNATLIASDATAVIGQTNRVVYMEDDEIAVCTPGSYQVLDFEAKAKKHEVQQVNLELGAIEKSGYDHFLLKEIMEQPGTVTNVLRGRLVPDDGTSHLGGLNMLPDMLRRKKAISIVACGSAGYCGLLGKYLFERLTGLPTSYENGSEFRYRDPVIQPNTLGIVISQSGETADTLASLREMKRRGVRTLGIINVVGSSIAREDDGGIYLHAGPEISVASTKVLTSMIIAEMLLALHIGRLRGLPLSTGQEVVAALQALPDQIDQVLIQAPHIKKLAKKFAKFDTAMFMGRDTLFPIALEGAIKLKEVSYVHAEAHAAGEMKHGPNALIDPELLVFFLLPMNPLYDKARSNLEEVRARHGRLLVLGTEGDDSLREFTEDLVWIPECSPWTQPILANIPQQLFAYYMAVERGTDVDQPRNLAKSVTVE
jgi:glucosamine--fructose-6-phosphate aminotransferase (isomerizing)